jgi:hypothetical protein
MKIFFAATIGFQVPIRSFGSGAVIARGFFFCVALLGKLAVGSLTPIFYDADETQQRYRGKHLRDCFVVGFSMMGEAEFAFVVAVFGVSQGLVPSDLYASIIWAILMSTIISPVLLRTTLAFFPYTDHKTSSEMMVGGTPGLKRGATGSTSSGSAQDCVFQLIVIQVSPSKHTRNITSDLVRVQKLLLCDLELNVVNQRYWWSNDMECDNRCLMLAAVVSNAESEQGEDLEKKIEHIQSTLQLSLPKTMITVTVEGAKNKKDGIFSHLEATEILASTYELFSPQAVAEIEGTKF